MQKLRKRYETLLGEFTQQCPLIDEYIETWKFTRPEEVLSLETKKLTLERTLQYVTQVLTSPNEPLSEADLDTLDQKLNHVETLIKLLTKDLKPRWQRIISSPITLLVLLLVIRSVAFSLHVVTSGSNEPTLLLGDRVLISHLSFLKNKIQRGDVIAIDSPEVPYEKKWTFKYAWQKTIGIEFPFFNLSARPPEIIKRVIALPGDTIQGVFEHGKATIYLNGKQLLEPYVNPYPLIAIKRKDFNLNSQNLVKQVLAPFLKETSQSPFVWLSFDGNMDNDEATLYKILPSQIVVNPNNGAPFLKSPEEFLPCDVFASLTIPQDTYWCLGDNRRNSLDSRQWGAIPASLIRGKVQKILYSIDEQESDWILKAIKDPVGFFKDHIRMNRFWKTIY